jgi:hypothetical protein
MYRSSETTFTFIKKEDPLNRYFENFDEAALPEDCVKVIVDAPMNTKFVNFFLNSNINKRIVINPPSDNVEFVNYAGMFSNCRKLNAEPEFDGSKNISMAAFYKSCQSMRFNVARINTSKVRDFRQCFWGAVNFTGIGLREWDFSSAVGPNAFNNFFGGGSRIKTRFYDELILSLHAQMKAGTLPTPMVHVDLADSQYSPYVADERQELIDYGWDLRDGGEVPYELSPLEQYFIDCIDDRIANGTFPGDIDIGPVCIGSRNGLLITPRHTLHVKHYMPSVGQKMELASGEIVEVASVESGWYRQDIGIATLKADATTRPAMVLPRNWSDVAMPNLAGPPTGYPDGIAPPMIKFKKKHTGLCDTSWASMNESSARMGLRIPIDPAREAWWQNIVMGDSGSAICFVYGNRLVASYALATSGGTGVFVASLRDILDPFFAETGHKVEECPVGPPIIPL